MAAVAAKVDASDKNKFHYVNIAFICVCLICLRLDYVITTSIRTCSNLNTLTPSHHGGLPSIFGVILHIIGLDKNRL